MKRWPEIRAGMIAIAIFFGLVDGCALPPPDKTSEWKRGFVEPIRSVRRIILTPVAWITPTLRVSQQWSLYQAPAVDRFRFSIEGQEPDGRWRILFRAADPEHTEDEQLLDYTRPRGAWDPTDRPGGQYLLFAGWVTARMLAKHPELNATRVRLEKVRIVDGGFESTGEFVHTHMRLRGSP